MTTEERLETLERELARAKRRNCWLLAGLVLCLGALVVVWALGWNTPGRYALSEAGGAAYVLDTKTSRLWVRSSRGSCYLGTNDNPKFERKEIP
jgi:hypothetical protein